MSSRMPYVLGWVICLSVLLLIYDFQSEDWINIYYMLKGFLKAHRPPKCHMKWNVQMKGDIKFPGCDPEQMCAQGECGSHYK